MKYSQEEKALWVEDWQQSGQSVWAYAKSNGLCPQTFVNWTKPKKENKHALVEIPLQILSATQQTQEILVEKGDMRIHIPLPVGSSELHAIFSALGNAV